MPTNELLGEADLAPLFKCWDTAQELQEDLLSLRGVQQGRGGSSHNGRVLPCLYGKRHGHIVGRVGVQVGYRGRA